MVSIPSGAVVWDKSLSLFMFLPSYFKNRNSLINLLVFCCFFVFVFFLKYSEYSQPLKNCRDDKVCFNYIASHSLQGYTRSIQPIERGTLALIQSLLRQAAKHASVQAVLDCTSIMENGFFDIVNTILNITASLSSALEWDFKFRIDPKISRSKTHRNA